ncbi:MAG TPA: hypothetical protein VFU31_31510, partial [Candidatus Binatia bacterium]|nr:hypothetical protein [Candidatus Binatia bacterium]
MKPAQDTTATREDWQQHAAKGRCSATPGGRDRSMGERTLFRRKLSSVVVSFLTALLLAACGTTTVTPMIRPTGGLPRPDRVLVFDFAVTPQEAGLERSPRFVRQTEEETR